MPLPLLGLIGAVAALWWFGTGGGAPSTCAPLPDRVLPIAGSPYRRPLESWRLTSPFGWRTLRGKAQNHTGADFSAPTGTPIYAVIGGRVAVVTTAGVGRGVENGNAVAILGTDGIVWDYLHMSCRAANVVPGATIRPGQFLGLVGATGDATGPHLHLQADVRGVPTDPLPILGINPAANS